MRRLLNYSRGFLIAASAYRRHSDSRLDFSAAALDAQFRHETYGERKPDPAVNGYTYGKMSLNITLAAMREDYDAGLFCKAELLAGSCAFARRVIRHWPPRTLFAWETR